MDAFGIDIVIVETVGVGQSEVDIVKTADTTMVVLIPGMGDDIQAIKAGILEIGDLFTINKADREGVDRLNIEIQMMLELNPKSVAWKPPINRTIASDNQGVVQVVDSIEEHAAYMRESKELAVRRAERIKTEISAMINEQINRYIAKEVINTSGFDNTVKQLQERETNPYAVVDEIVSKVLK